MALDALALNGHDVLNMGWQARTLYTARQERGRFRDLFHTDNMFRDLRTHKEIEFRGPFVHCYGTISPEYEGCFVANVGVTHAQKLKLDINPGCNPAFSSYLYALDSPLPIYTYYIKGVLKQGVVQPYEQHRLALPCTPKVLRFIIGYTLMLSNAQIDDIFRYATGRTIERHPMLCRAEITHRQAFDLIVQVLEKYVRHLLELDDEDELPEEDELDASIAHKSEDVGDDAANPLKLTLATQRPMKSKDYVSVKFAVHPESKRFFGHKSFFELSHIYHEPWLMGLTIHDLDALYARVSENCYSACFSDINCANMASNEHYYVSKDEFSVKIDEVSLQGFVAACRYFPRRFTAAEYIDVLLYNALKLRVFEGDTYATLTGVHDAIQTHKLFKEARAEMPEVTELTIALLLDAAFRLHARGLIYVHHLDGDFSDMYNSERGIPNTHPMRVYLKSVYTSEAILVATIYRIYTQARLATAKGEPFYVNELSAETSANLCSEQRFLIDNLPNNPVATISGPGGTGKTFVLNVLGEMFGDKILYLAAQNTHVNLLAEGSTRRVSTLHMILQKHEYYCKNQLDECTQRPDEYRTLQKIQIAVRNRIALREANPSHTPSTSDRVWSSCTRCPFENLTAVFTDEISRVDRTLLQRVLFTLSECAPGLRAMVTCGDPGQMQSFGFGDVVQDLVKGLGGFEFQHTHRSNVRTLRRNAERVRRRKAIIFDGEEPDTAKDDPLSERAFARVMFFPSRNQKEELFEALNTVLEANPDFTVQNTQFITRTNEVKFMCQSYVRNRMLKLPDGQMGGIFRGQKVMYRKGCIGDVGSGQVMLAWGVVWVKQVIDYGMELPPLQREMQTLCELVDTTRIIPASAGENPKNVSEFICLLAAGELQLSDAVYNTNNTRENASRLAKKGCFSPHPDLNLLLKNACDHKDSCGSSAATDLGCYLAQVCDLQDNTTVGSRTRSENAVPLIACLPLNSAEAVDLPPLNYKTLWGLILDRRVSFLPYFGTTHAEDATFLTVAAVQGSSSWNVVHVMTKFSPYETPRTLYTAFTRAERCYVAVGDKRAFHQAAEKNQDPERLSALGTALGRLREHFADGFPAPRYDNAALLEYQEIKRRRKYFDFLPEHPKKFIQPYAASLGLSVEQAELRLAAMAANVPLAPVPCTAEMDFDDGIDDSVVTSLLDEEESDAISWEDAYGMLTTLQLGDRLNRGGLSRTLQ